MFPYLEPVIPGPPVAGKTPLASREVAIPTSHFKLSQGRLLLRGATKEVLKALPPFGYRRSG